jgi:hypothetical protein
MDYDFEPFLHLATVSAVCQLVLDTLDTSSSESDEEEHVERRPRPFSERRKFPRKDYSMSQQAQMLIHGWHLDPLQKDFHDFREVYRVPAAYFEDFCSSFKTYYNHDSADCTGRVAVPINLKILSCFFILATGVSFKHMAKTIGCGEETIRSFFFIFLTTVCEKYGPQFIEFPQTEADIRRCVETYEGEHLPGCLGSIDCTHIGWVRARASVRSWFVGNALLSSHSRSSQSCCQAKKGCPRFPCRSSWTTQQECWL